MLIDEYDKPILDVLDNRLTTEVDGERRPIEDVNREILKGFYSVFKAADEDLQFVLLTGVTKFSLVSLFSGFNQPADISMDRRLEALCGITETEMYDYYDKAIKVISVRYKYTKAEKKEFLKRQYDGYYFSYNLTDIYNSYYWCPLKIFEVFSKL